MKFKGYLAPILLAFLSCESMEEKAQNYAISQEPENRNEAAISLEEIEALPPIVQEYFLYSRVLGKPRPRSFSLTARGRLRNSSGSNWLDVESRQLNRMMDLSRVYYIEVLGFPMKGIDSLLEGRGRMEIQLFGFFNLGDVTGPEMDESALTTYLNDLVFCPSAYFSVPVEWEQVGETQALLGLSYQGVEVSAMLTFSKEGRLIHWESGNRYASIRNEFLQDNWSTHYYEYGLINGMMVPTKVDVVHDYDDEPYVYGRFDQILSMEINAEQLP